MNYDRSLVIAKQLVSRTKITRVITPSGAIYQEGQWDGEVIYRIKALKTRLAVIYKGKDINKPARVKKPVSKDK